MLLSFSPGRAVPATEGHIVLDVQIIEGFIITQASVDGETGNFIVDTGAPGLVLNAEQGADRKADCMSVNQAFSCMETTVGEFRWNHIKRRGITALVTDLSEIEKAVGFEIFGLIGFNLFRKEKLFINFSRQEIVFLPRKETNAELTFKAFANFVMPFAVEYSIPVIEYRLNGKDIRLAIDSGAKSNVLDKSIADLQDPDWVMSRGPIEVAGVDASILVSEVITLYNEDAPNPYVTQDEFVIADLSHLRESGLHIDGLVGPAFFENCLLLFDFQEMKIYAGFAN